VAAALGLDRLGLSDAELRDDLESFGQANAGLVPFAFGQPPPWLVAAAAAGCSDLTDVMRASSLEHQGPIDALSVSSEALAEFNRWLLVASKRVEYLRQKALEAKRVHAIEDERAAYRRRGAALQQQALEQRSNAAAAERNMMEWKQATASHLKQEAAARKADAQVREQAYQHAMTALHDAVVEGEEMAGQARAAVATHKAAVGSHIRSINRHLEARKDELRAAKEAQARQARNRVREAGMVMVPAEIAAQINGGR